MTPEEIIARRRRLLELAESSATSARHAGRWASPGPATTSGASWRTPTGWRRSPPSPGAARSCPTPHRLTWSSGCSRWRWPSPPSGPRQLADRLGDEGFAISKTPVAKILTEHALSRRSQRLARAAAREAEPFGFCHVAPGPGELMALGSFYIGNLKGVGKAYQLSAVDTDTRWAVIAIVAGPPTAELTARFLAQVVRFWRRHGSPVTAVLTDNGPEYLGRTFTAALAAKGVCHVRIPPRSPNHNAVVERFHRTVLQECWCRRSTAAGSAVSANSRPRPTPGSSPTTMGPATTVPTCAAAPQPDPRQLPPASGSMTTDHRPHPPARKL